MSLTREQYDEIMRGYMQKQNRRHQLTLQRRDEVYARIPEFRQLSDRVSEIAVDYLHSRLGEKKNDSSVSPGFVRPQLEEIAARKKELLVSHGYPEDYLTVSPECPLCGDTGFVDGQKCRCFRQKEVERCGAAGISRRMGVRVIAVGDAGIDSGDDAVAVTREGYLWRYISCL